MKSRNRLHHNLGWLRVLALSGAFSTAQANDLQLGMQLLELGQTEQTIELWRPLAKSGNAEAQFGLGVIYNDAMGVPQDYIEANYWFLRAAEQGYASAQYNLGNAYKNGTGMAVDAQLAVIWWRKSAEQGFGPAQYNLGTAYLEGKGVAHDESLGRDWYQRAAASGHSFAQVYLAEHATNIAAPSNAPDPEHVSAMAVTAPQVARTDTAGAQPAENHLPAPAAQTAATKITPPATALNNNTAQCEEWLNQGSDKGYSIQLTANRQLNWSEDFVRQHGLSKSVVCTYSVNNQLWHAVFYGQYPSVSDARAALVLLPAGLHTGGAYPRRLEEIRQALKATP